MVADPSGEWVRASDALAARQPVRIYGCCAQPEGELHTAECPNMRHLAARQPVTMDDALAAGDGTLHGAIDHWQERALRAEAELAARQPVGISAEWVLGYLTTDAPEDSREAIRNAFTEYAALSGVRQPVGEPEIWVSPGQLEEHKRRPAGQGSNYLPTRLACEGNFTQPLYTAPPAQQPAQVYLDGLDRALGEAIDQRDRYHEVADDLAGHIAAITGVDIGEHSSANCPWQNAIEAAEEYKPAQAVDLGQLQRFAPHPENRAFGWMEGMREEASGDWLHIDDVRALIDSQAEVQS
ncbi:hypothetical protein VN11_08565 [Stenotrophomonas maltophilia]|nr:hypothetical protein VN11_08565 [Stenotrophomonas maltophilia]